MSARPLQWAILHRNLFVERFIPQGTRRTLTSEEMAHYRGVQPTPASRVGVAELPRQIRRATPFLVRLAEEVPRRFGDTPALIIFPMRDTAFRPAEVLPRLLSALPEAAVVKLPNAGHFFVEDAPDEVAQAIAAHFPHRVAAAREEERHPRRGKNGISGGPASPSGPSPGQEQRDAAAIFGSRWGLAERAGRR
jgi:haloalkane dehalogenase